MNRVPPSESSCQRCRRLRVRCPKHRPSNRVAIARACGQCSKPFSSAYLRQRFCSTRCQMRATEKRLGRRSGRGAGRRFPRVRYAARQAIFERDAWTCQLCGAPIDRDRRFPDPGSATIDHRDPDGPHDPTNWQAAHLGCNVSKAHKVAIGADPKLVVAR